MADSKDSFLTAPMDGGGETLPLAARDQAPGGQNSGGQPSEEQTLEMMSTPTPGERADTDAGKRIGADVNAMPAYVGPYRVLERLGEGGMGTVYKAEQRSPVKRTVALKVIRLGMGSAEMLVRFESERQALARMSHAHIARVLDAGADEVGRPYFVMEYVPGLPVTKFADVNRFSIRQRLELFTQVCEAIAHAHTKAILHRDIKASNVLAFMDDGKPTVKVIDFGIAKATTDERLSDRTFNTHRGQAIGTYESMSPEQVEGSPDIDTRTDVYSLGVLLYELLAGAAPFDGRVLRSAADAEIRRIICEVEPPRPSTRLSDLGAAGTDVAAARREQSDALVRLLRGELEWIPLMAMRKERERRYASPLELAADIQNYLANRPLKAGPESVSYRLRKAIRRNRRPLATAAVFVALLAASVGVYIHTINAARHDLQAEQGRTLAALEEVTRKKAEVEQQKAQVETQRSAAEIQKNKAIEERDNATAVLDFLTDRVLSGATPEKIPDLAVRQEIIRAMIEPAARSVGEAFENRPLVEATLRNAIGTTLDKIGRADLALSHYELALERRTRLLGADDPDTLQSKNNYGSLLKSLGRVKEAEPIYKDVLERQTRLHGPDSPDTIRALNNYSALLNSIGRAAEAEPLAKDAMERITRLRGPDHPEAIQMSSNLGSVLLALGRLAEAEPIYKDAMERRSRLLGMDHPDTIQSMNNYASVLYRLGRVSEAEPLWKEALERRTRLLGADHPNVLISQSNYAGVLYAMGRSSDAEAMWRDALKRATDSASVGPRHPTTKALAMNLSGLMDKLSRPDEATEIRQRYGIGR